MHTYVDRRALREVAGSHSVWPSTQPPTPRDELHEEHSLENWEYWMQARGRIGRLQRLNMQGDNQRKRRETWTKNNRVLSSLQTSHRNECCLCYCPAFGINFASTWQFFQFRTSPWTTVMPSVVGKFGTNLRSNQASGKFGKSGHQFTTNVDRCKSSPGRQGSRYGRRLVLLKHRPLSFFALSTNMDNAYENASAFQMFNRSCTRTITTIRD